jgi:hypothetical protein
VYPLAQPKDGSGSAVLSSSSWRSRVAVLVAQPLLHALAWPTVVVGNLFAAVGMAAVLWHRHPALSIWP